MTLLERYLNGEFEGVWNEIYELQVTPDVLLDVKDVSDETMGRVRRNLALISSRLCGQGFVFNHPRDALGDPSQRVDELLAKIDGKLTRMQIDGFSGQPLPPSVRAFYKIIGSVNLSGFSPCWPAPVPTSPDYSAKYFLGDGLVVFSLEKLILGADEIRDGSSALAFSPDIFHKEDISGGAPYAFDVVSPSLDAFCTEIETGFVPYLRWSLTWGGFPGLRHYQNAPTEWVTDLIEGLEPF